MGHGLAWHENSHMGPADYDIGMAKHTRLEKSLLIVDSDLEDKLSDGRVRRRRDENDWCSERLPGQGVKREAGLLADLNGSHVVHWRRASYIQPIEELNFEKFLPRGSHRAWIDHPIGNRAVEGGFKDRIANLCDSVVKLCLVCRSYSFERLEVLLVGGNGSRIGFGVC